MKIKGNEIFFCKTHLNKIVLDLGRRVLPYYQVFLLHRPKTRRKLDVYLIVRFRHFPSSKSIRINCFLIKFRVMITYIQ